eukprot:TRINITY_DN17056_c0_g1_i3.p1 TRINITY_DN17056_c0_g1~~TRINITY_DN17056_c0_g1_i3.p1  ORF type:complete len:336 (-),score=17.51 TRINITY_DN17056_c0_g1_i3:41-946(-)
MPGVAAALRVPGFGRCGKRGTRIGLTAAGVLLLSSTPALLLSWGGLSNTRDRTVMMSVPTSLSQKSVKAEFWPVNSPSLPPDAKVLYFVRHAEGTHNVNKEYRLPIHLDAKLTAVGEAQCKELAGKTRSLPVDVIVSSPLTRCLQTASLGFSHALSIGTPLVAQEHIRETVNFCADRRRLLSAIAADFPLVDFSLIETEEDALWARYEAIFGDYLAFQAHRESDDFESLAVRGRAALCFLASRPEKYIAVVSHNAFLTHLFNTDLRNLSVTFSDDALREHLCSTWQNCELRADAVVISCHE